MRTIVILLFVSHLGAQYHRGSKPTGRPGSDLDILSTAVASFDGTLRSLDHKHVLLEMGEEQTLSMEVNKKTQYFRGATAIRLPRGPCGTPPARSLWEPSSRWRQRKPPISWWRSVYG